MAHGFANINTVANDARGATIQGAFPAEAADTIEALLGAYPSPASTVTELLEGGFAGAISTLDIPHSGGIVDGQAFLLSTVSIAAAGATEFAIDLVVVNPADGVISVIAGADTTDQTEASAVAPALSGDLVELFRVTMSSAVITLLDQAQRGEGLDVTAPSIAVSAGVVDGQEVDEASVSIPLSAATEFARDLVTVDPADGTLTVTAGAETSDQTAASAVVPATPGDEVILFVALVSDSGVDAIEQDARGSGLDTTLNLSVVLSNGAIDGVVIDEATQVFVASSASNFAKDLVSVDDAGVITITAGTEAATAILAEVPDVPADEFALYVATVANAATGITAIDASVRGKLAPVSADETITL